MATKMKAAPVPSREHVALAELHELALQARAAAERKIADLAGDGVARSLRTELSSRSELLRGYLMALSTLGVVSAESESQWYEYITGQRDSEPVY